MGIQRRLPEGDTVRLQEAVTWAFTGWAYFNATDAELREREELADSIYGLLPPLSESDERFERDEHLFRNFDLGLSDACFRGLVEVVGRKNSYSEYERIPAGYFFRARGFVDFAESRISETPACSTFEEIASSGLRGGWIDVIVNRAQFISWFFENRSSFFTGGKSTYWPQENACGDGSVPFPTAEEKPESFNEVNDHGSRVLRLDALPRPARGAPARPRIDDTKAFEAMVPLIMNGESRLGAAKKCVHLACGGASEETKVDRLRHGFDKWHDGRKSSG